MQVKHEGLGKCSRIQLILGSGFLKITATHISSSYNSFIFTCSSREKKGGTNENATGAVDPCFVLWFSSVKF